MWLSGIITCPSSDTVQLAVNSNMKLSGIADKLNLVIILLLPYVFTASSIGLYLLRNNWAYCFDPVTECLSLLEDENTDWSSQELAFGLY